MSDDRPAARDGRPSGEVYDWFRRAEQLLANGDAAAAVPLLQHALEIEPDALSLRERLARALFDSGRFVEAESTFTELSEADPADHYAHFGRGLALTRQGKHELALEPLALAAAMRPDIKAYTDALHQARATVQARRDARGIRIVEAPE